MHRAKKSALGIFLALAVMFGGVGAVMMASPAAHAAPARGVQPLSTECGAPGWVTVKSTTYSHTDANSHTYKAVDTLQESYDSQFGTWCGTYRTTTTLTTSSGSSAGTFYALVAPCGIPSQTVSSSGRNFSGGGTWSITTPVDNNIGAQAEGGDHIIINSPSANWGPEYGSCAGN